MYIISIKKIEKEMNSSGLKIILIMIIFFTDTMCK